MATKYQFKQKTEERRLRTFSDEFKRKKVREIEQKSTTIAEVSRQYEVREANVSKWIKKYSTNYMKGVRVIVESESDTTKIALLEKKLAELERLVGQKQIRLEFYEKMIELAEEQYQVDIKKKFGEKPSTGSGTTEKI